MSLINFYKGLQSDYDAHISSGVSFDNDIFQCTDTGNTYIFGVLNRSYNEDDNINIIVLDVPIDLPNNNDTIVNLDDDKWLELNQAISDNKLLKIHYSGSHQAYLASIRGNVNDGYYIYCLIPSSEMPEAGAIETEGTDGYITVTGWFIAAGSTHPITYSTFTVKQTIINGSGDMFLADDGTYKQLASTSFYIVPEDSPFHIDIDDSKEDIEAKTYDSEVWDAFVSNTFHKCPVMITFEEGALGSGSSKAFIPNFQSIAKQVIFTYNLPDCSGMRKVTYNDESTHPTVTDIPFTPSIDLSDYLKYQVVDSAPVSPAEGTLYLIPETE